MATVKVVLKNKPNAQGKYPLAVKVVKDRKPSLRFLGHYVLKSQWDAVKQRVKKSHPNSTKLNNLIAQKVAEVSETLIDLDEKNPNASAQDILQTHQIDKNKPTFFQVAQEYLDHLEKTGKYTRLTADKSRVQYFREFLKGKDIQFSDVNVSLLKRFASYLKSERKVSQRTVMNYYVVIRCVFSLGITKGAANKDDYPFGRGKITIKFPQSVKMGWSKEEVKALEDYEGLEVNSSAWHARNLWLMSFYFAGMRASDVLQLKWADFSDGRLYYKMDKNSKAGSLKLTDKAMVILALYNDRKTAGQTYVFPFLDDVNTDDPSDKRRKIGNGIGLCNKHLKRIAKQLEINKPLTMHIARHTFGNLSGDRIPIQMLQKLYRHSSITTTIGYQSNFINKSADDALEAVIS